MMNIQLKKKPNKPIIIQGFPGFGLVGTIATEFLIEHLKPELIGEFFYDELPVTVAIHKEKLVKPMAIYYDKQYNLVILHTILNVTGYEWKIADKIVEMAKLLKAKEIICLEGVASQAEQEIPTANVYSYGVKNAKDLHVQPLQESIIIGVTAAMLLKYPDISCFFAETHTSLPDSKAAAKLIEVLDKYLKLKVDYVPLIKQAEEFETKIKGLLQQSNKTIKEKETRDMSYLG
ncbi:proteasome assembly chaperone family protein [Candidatus Woesearchaeota archaeon]|nr:MAG: proteasome assembly chaperone family protein [Candidatus Woesearchaeota archaeon]